MRRAWWLVACLLLQSCQSGNPDVSFVVVRIDAENAVMARTAKLRLQVDGKGARKQQKDELVAPRWPIEVELKAEGPAAPWSYRVSATAIDAAGQSIASARLISNFVRRDHRYITLMLEDACLGLAEPCAATDTCHQGACAIAEVPAIRFATEPAPPKLANTMLGRPPGPPLPPPPPPPPAKPEELPAFPQPCGGGFRVAAGCVSMLLDVEPGRLSPIDYALSPAFDPAVLHYRLRLPIGAHTFQLTALVQDGVRVQVKGTELKSGEPWTSPALGLGPTSFALKVIQKDREVVYTIYAERGEPVDYVKPNDTGTHRGFSNVAIEGDTLVVGSSGAVYVFMRHAGIWEQSARLMPTQALNPGALYSFGYRVALSHDTIVTSGTGGAYVFAKAGGAWRQEAFLEAAGAEWWDCYVAIDGDTIVLGAPNYGAQFENAPGDETKCGTGTAYVFVRKAGAWIREARLTASNAGDGDRFGISVGVSGNTIIVGAPGEDSGLSPTQRAPAADEAVPNSGAVYVFGRTGASWLQQAVLKAPVAHSPTEAERHCADDGRGFGFRVAIAGNALVVSDPGEFDASNTKWHTGAVYVLVRSGDSWNLQGRLIASNPDQRDRFGFSIALSGDDIVVGAVGEDSAGKGVDDVIRGQADNSAEWAGAAYWFVRRDGKWRQQAYLKASNTGAGDYFGQSVGVSGGSIAVGAGEEDSAASGVNHEHPGPEDDSLSESGAVYVY